MNTKLAGKANSSHTHGSGDITSLDASKLTGTISIDRLPTGALERCVIVETDADRLKLTTASVQKGDTVKVTGTGKMYFVIDDTKLTSEDGYTVYTAGSATSVPWSGVTGKPSTFTPSSHTHTKSQITDFPGALKNPSSLVIKLNGGATEGTNMFTYDGSAAKSFNITPSSIGAATSGHTHNYAGSSSAGGNANAAVKLATARNFSIGGGAIASAVSFNGSSDVTFSVTSLNTNYLVNGSNTLILSCGSASV